jgi:hypothetical protein
MVDKHIDENLEERVRSHVRYESEQTDRRIKWLGAFEGFLFASFGLLYTSQKFYTNLTIPRLVCFLGFVIALLILTEIYAGVLGTIKLRKYCKSNGLNPKNRPDLFGYYPDKWSWTVFTSGEPLICYAIMITWCVLFFQF